MGLIKKKDVGGKGNSHCVWVCRAKKKKGTEKKKKKKNRREMTREKKI